MAAWETASIYFGSFLGLGLVVKSLLRHWTGGDDPDIRDVQNQIEPRRGKRRVFLLGAWRDEGSA